METAAVERLCRTEPDARALRSAILRELARATHFRWCVWLLTDPGTGVGADPRLDVFCRAHGLSARERELMQHLVRGVDSRELGAAMHLSRYTVQDHLTSIFDRTGVRSRRVLLARVLGVGDHAGASGGTAAT